MRDNSQKTNLPSSYCIEVSTKSQKDGVASVGGNFINTETDEE